MPDNRAKRSPNRKRLTSTMLERLKPPAEGTQIIWDALQPGFGIALSAGGKRTFVVMGRVLKNGVKRPARMSLGDVGDVGLAEARDKARAWRKAAAADEDPRQTRRAARAQRVEASRLTFGLLVEDFLATHGAELRPRVLDEYCRTLRRICSGWPASDNGSETLTEPWADRPVASIGRADVRVLIETIRRQHATAAAHTLKMLSSFFAWCIANREDVEDVLVVNPARGIKGPKITKRDRVPSPAELADIWACLDAARGPLGDWLRILLLTAQRRSEVAGMAWSELDNPAAPQVWTIPAARMKNGQPHHVPLSRQVAEIIARQPRTDSPLVFGTRRSTTSKTPPTVGSAGAAKSRVDAAIAKRRADRGDSPITPWRLHDFRRAFATLAGELEDIRPYVRAQRAEGILAGLARHGVETTTSVRALVALQAGDGSLEPHVLDAVLSHRGARAGVAGVYNRAAYIADARVALQAWADWIESLAKPVTTTIDNVVRLHATG